MYSVIPFSELIRDKMNKQLIFIHTPKCYGTYIGKILTHLKIKNKQHRLAIPNEGISFTVIRNPVERFESLLNYRLGEKNPRGDWPKHLINVYEEKNVELNEIVAKMTDKEILGFSPYSTIKYWTQNVDIIITLENLPKFLEHFGYTYDKNLFVPLNVSIKTRGKLDQQNKDRIAALFNDDMIIYNKITTSVLHGAHGSL